MTDFNTFMSIGLEQCAPSGTGSQAARQQVFSGLVDIWNREKATIEGMTEAELRSNLTCP